MAMSSIPPLGVLCFAPSWPMVRTIRCFRPGRIENWTSSSFFALPVHVDRIEIQVDIKPDIKELKIQTFSGRRRRHNPPDWVRGRRFRAIIKVRKILMMAAFTTS